MRNDILDLVKGLTNQDTKTLTEKALKLCSESGELASKALSFDNVSGARHRFSDRNDILEEVADIMLVALSVAYSLDFDDDDISSMMHDKSIKWSSLASSDKSDGNYPYEIHLTIDKVKHINNFISDCRELGNVKPIILELETEDGGEQQVTTSSVVMGDYNKTRNTMKDLVHKMKDLGYKVIREKIETVPWHPVTMSKSGLYFETHFTFVIDENEVEKLREACNSCEVHLSSNILKSDLGDGMVKIMGTYRSTFADEKKHRVKVNLIKSIISKVSVPTKVISEYAVYDTKQNLDDKWLRI